MIAACRTHCAAAVSRVSPLRGPCHWPPAQRALSGSPRSRGRCSKAFVRAHFLPGRARMMGSRAKSLNEVGETERPGRARCARLIAVWFRAKRASAALEGLVSERILQKHACPEVQSSVVRQTFLEGVIWRAPLQGHAPMFQYAPNCLIRAIGVTNSLAPSSPVGHPLCVGCWVYIGVSVTFIVLTFCRPFPCPSSTTLRNTSQPLAGACGIGSSHCVGVAM